MSTNQERRDAGFAVVVERAIYDLHVEQGYVAPKDGKRVARSILMKLHERGLAIHDPANCVRRPWQDRARQAAPETIGREMTLEEQIATGVVAVSDDVP